MEQVDVLAHVADLLAHALQRERLDVQTVHLDRAAIRLVVAQQQLDDGRFSGAGRPHDADGLAGGQLERHAVEHVRPFRVSEVHVVEGDHGCALLQRRRPLLVDDGRLEVDHGEHPAGTRLGLLNLVDQHPEDEQRHRHPRRHQQEDDQPAGRDVPEHHQVATGGGEQPEGDARDHVDPRQELGTLDGGTDGVVHVRARLATHPLPLVLLGVVRLHDTHAGDVVGQHGVDVTERLAGLAVLALHPGGEEVDQRQDDGDRHEQDDRQFPGDPQQDEERGGEGDHDADHRCRGVGEEVLKLVHVG